MRKVDEQKKQLIEQAILVITKDEGIQGLSFSKIAKYAHVSSGTPYVYFKDKTDMLSQMFLKIKLLFDDRLQADIEKGKSMPEKIYQAVTHFARMYTNYPLEAIFITAIRANPELVTKTAFAEGNASAQPLNDLFQQAVTQQCLVTDNIEAATVLLFGPFIMQIQERQAAHQAVGLDELEAVIQLSVDGLIKK
ncbi:TetR/AcrR family transcriptional regulator [Furfurilactobacillus sp. WILCCON 0119]